MRLALAGADGALAVAGMLLLPLPAATENAQAAAGNALAAFVVRHAGMAAIAALYSLSRLRAGFVSAVRDLALRNTALLAAYATGTGILTLALIHLLPLAAQ